MNNKHQELIEEKVNKYTEADSLFRLGEGELERLARLQNLLVEILQDTIDTVLEGERERVGKRYITLINQAIGDTKLPEDVWKKIAKVNQLILDI